MKRYLSLGLSLLLLCGCTSTVSTVTDPPDSSPSPSELVLAEGVVPLEQALSESRELDLQDSVNLKFAPGVALECPDTVYRGQMMQIADFSDQYGDQLLHWWIPDEVWDDAYYIPQEEAEGYPYGPIYEDENGWYADSRCTGTVFYSKGEGQTFLLYDSDYDFVTAYAVFFPDESLQDSYPMEDGDLTIQQAVQMGNEYADEWCALTDFPQQLRVEYVYVHDRGDGTYFYRLYYQSFLDGAFLDSVYSRTTFDHFEYHSMSGIISSVEGFSCWGAGTGGVIPYDTTTTCEEILPLGDAIEILSTKLSSYTAYDVKRVALSYRLTLDGTAQTPDQYRATDKDGNLIPDCEVKLEGGSYQLYQLHPSWAFYMTRPSGRVVVCFVDAQTGEVSVVDNG